MKKSSQAGAAITPAASLRDTSHAGRGAHASADMATPDQAGKSAVCPAIVRDTGHPVSASPRKSTALPEEKSEPQRQSHEFGPVYDKNSRILILGSFPSVKSREQAFYYGHPQNRFWKVLAALYRETPPQSMAEKREFALRHGIALWDVIESCEIRGSSDASIRNVVPVEIERITDFSPIEGIFVNGGTAKKYYDRYLKKRCGREAVLLPSTSPANAAWSLLKLTEVWGEKLLHRSSRQGSTPEVS